MNFSLDLHPIILENDRVLLRALSHPKEARCLHTLLLTQELLRFSPSSVNNKEEAEKYFVDALAGHAGLIRYPFLIFDKQTKKWVGSTSYGNISNVNKRIEIGWTWISYESQRTGLNRNSKFLLIQYALETLDFNRVELKSDARNEQSRKAMEGIGAKYEGCLRSHVIMPDGFLRDTVYYSILKEEWTGLKESIFKNIS